MMIRAVLLVGVVSALAVGGLAADDKTEPKQEAKLPGLELFKQLAGQWVGKELEGKKDMEVRASYKVTSGGTAVVETLGPGEDHEMITVITRDGDDLILTHYCMLGNQPQMKAAGKGDGKEVAFKFVKAGNMKSDKDPHMHDVTYKFVDQDTLRTEWVHYMEGKPAGKVVFEMKRKK